MFRNLHLVLVVGLGLLACSVSELGGGKPVTQHHVDGSLLAEGYENENGLKTGRWTYWYPNGEKESEGFLVDGELDGDWVFWYDSGLKSGECSFAYGERTGLWRVWHENGQIISEREFKLGLHDGQTTLWYPSGQIRLIAERVTGPNWENSQFEGRVDAWNEDGTRDIEQSGFYRKGEKVRE